MYYPQTTYHRKEKQGMFIEKNYEIPCLFFENDTTTNGKGEYGPPKKLKAPSFLVFGRRGIEHAVVFQNKKAGVMPAT